MAPKYDVGQKVIVVPASDQTSARDSKLEQYAGQSGQITDYHWIDRDRKVFYIYTVRIDSDKKEVVLHEDELKAYVA